MEHECSPAGKRLEAICGSPHRVYIHCNFIGDSKSHFICLQVLVVRIPSNLVGHFLGYYCSIPGVNHQKLNTVWVTAEDINHIVLDGEAYQHCIWDLHSRRRHCSTIIFLTLCTWD